jgi:hypothetical protein
MLFGFATIAASVSPSSGSQSRSQRQHSQCRSFGCQVSEPHRKRSRKQGVALRCEPTSAGLKRVSSAGEGPERIERKFYAPASAFNVHSHFPRTVAPLVAANFHQHVQRRLCRLGAVDGG